MPPTKTSSDASISSLLTHYGIPLLIFVTLYISSLFLALVPLYMLRSHVTESFSTRIVVLTVSGFIVALYTLVFWRVAKVVSHQSIRERNRLQRRLQGQRDTKAESPITYNTAPNNIRKKRRGHLLIVLGSGGHTAEMIQILETLGPEYLNSRFERRTWVVSSGDGFSAERARALEMRQEQEGEAERQRSEEESAMEESGRGTGKEKKLRGRRVRWDIVVVRRARRVHQSLLTTPWSALWCLWDCLRVLRGVHADLTPARQFHEASDSRRRNLSPYPNLILTNGPGTGVIVVLASLLLMFLGLAPITNTNTSDDREDAPEMRSIYIESWARVKTLSLSGKLLRGMVDRFLVQWTGLADVDATRVDNQNERECNGEIERRNSGGGVGGKLLRKREYIGAVVT